jgi:hypothetical protein
MFEFLQAHKLDLWREVELTALEHLDSWPDVGVFKDPFADKFRFFRYFESLVECLIRLLEALLPPFLTETDFIWLLLANFHSRCAPDEI